MTQTTAADNDIETDTDVESKRQFLRRVSVTEAVSFLVLLVASVVKRTVGPEVGVQLMGPVHGVLFVGYTVLIIRDHRPLGWSRWKMLGAIVLGSLPFGGFLVERRWLRDDPRRHASRRQGRP